eukprot:TRINITY_DN74996_c0_g1_i1.p1 TRINITY_DN74996_c0_g1~~TRINITY_DN74996_c0_g1_i1.p1  ORF type:complete len:310 (-),score=65.50 TRINITY_DN74996_c0_g1_i1:76-1005(-)
MVTRLLDRKLLRLAGPDVHSFLQGLITADVRLLQSEVSTLDAAENKRSLVSAGFLSPKGRLLADCILHDGGPDCVLVDAHKDVAGSLLRLLRRHRLRMPLEIDEDGSRSVVVSQTQADGLNADPRYAGLGFRGLVAADAAAEADASWYLRRRVISGVPEGPADLGVDREFPLHGNLDLLGTVCFSKGCYVGQELTARTYWRGAVRKRFVVVTTSEKGPSEAGDAEALHMPSSTSEDDGAEPQVQAPQGGKWNAVGVLRSVSGDSGLCQVKLPGQANSKKAFAAVFEELPPLYFGGVRLYPQLPAYCAAE